jgi:uncharacterized damage-inducible protein DinB
MSETPILLEALLDSWQRNTTILLKLLRALPQGGLEAQAMEGSPSVAVQFSHLHSTRLFFLGQTAPGFAADLTQLFKQDGETRRAEHDPARIAEALLASSQAVGAAVRQAVESGQALKGEHVAYDHPILLLQHLLWHEGYHVGQIKLALKAVGHVMSETTEEQTIWSVWRQEVWS